MEFKETSNGVFNHNNEKHFRFVIVNSHLNPQHKHKGTNFTLTVGKPDFMFPIGDFWSLELAQQAAKNVQQLIGALV